MISGAGDASVGERHQEQEAKRGKLEKKPVRDGVGIGARLFCPKVATDSACPDFLQFGPCMKGTNYNVVLVNILGVCFGLAESIWTGTALSAYLYMLTNNSNTRVGYVEAAQGISSLVFALPTGYLADRFSRSMVIMFGGFISIIATAVTSYAVYQGAEDNGNWETHYNTLLGSMCVWGVIQGVVNGPAQALYADSTPQGDRSKYYQYLFIGWGLSSVAGPLITIMLFAIYGNNWTLKMLRNVILAGLAVEFLTALVMLFFRDDCAIQEDGQSEEESDEESPARENRKGEYKEIPAEDDSRPVGNPPKLKRTVTEEFLNEVSYCNGWLTRKSVPYILFCSDLVTALGSGMTVKYFPLFFKNEVHMSPIEVQIIYTVCPIGMVLFSQIGTTVKTYIGRVQTIMLMRIIGVGLLITMAILADGITRSKYILVPIYVIRTGVMNCTYPLDESILMDFVPKKQRGRWKSLESVAAFGWCGSAVIGGYLGDQHGYSFTFIITAAVQGSSLLLTSLLLPLVPIAEQRHKDSISVSQHEQEDFDSFMNDNGYPDDKRKLLDPTSGIDTKSNIQ